MSSDHVAFVVGASRGIGRGCARKLAEAGFDVAVAARTVHEGSDPGGLPGSLDAVSKDVEAAGRKALACRLDLLDRASCVAAIEQTLKEFGRIDVVVNSGIYYGEGMRLFADTPIEEYDRGFAANVTGPLFIIQSVLPAMRAQGGGLVINVSSGAGQNETRALPGAGGWPLLYSITKAAINRATLGLAKELRRDRIAVVNLEPGVVATERMVTITSQQGIEGGVNGVSVDVPGAVCAHLAAHPTPMTFSGRTVDAPQFCVWAGLVDGTALPYPYGPTGWGAPPDVAVAGQTTGVGSGVHAPRRPLTRSSDMPIETFHAAIPDEELEDVARRLAHARFPDQIEGSGWSYGTDLATVKEWVAYWRDDFDWRAVEAQFNAFEQGITEALGERIHFVHAPSPEPNATPLVITHGWPGSVVEFLEVIEPLRNPGAHGGDPADAFHVVCPHIPGYGFSGPTRNAGFHIDRAAAAIADLMGQLGYERYVAQGGDWGAVITRRLAEAHAEHVLGAHFNMLFAFPKDLSAPEAWEGVTPEELETFGRASSRVSDGTGYSDIQGSKPQTLAYGMHDSPVALLAWQLEKFHEWSHAGLAEAYTKDQVLANVALYWFTHTANSASRLYCESKRQGNYAADPWEGKVSVPVGYCRYPGELLQTPRVWADARYLDIVHWTEADRGGHFAAFENPTFFVEDLRAFGRTLRA